QSNQREDFSAARDAGRYGPPAASAEAAFRTHAAADHSALPAVAPHVNADHFATTTSLVKTVRADNSLRDRTDDRATPLQPAPTQPMFPTPPAQTEHHAQARLTQHAAVKPTPDRPIDSASALPAIPQHPAALNAVTPTMLDAAWRAGLQTLAMRPHDRTRRTAPQIDSAGGGEPKRQTIQVSIGRIEIRATHSGASTAASARKNKSGPQPLGLDDYLRQRASGVRE
ncbi:MAG: hypothetical protein M3N23_02030, partial [Pseudomonadota bacterium]|nr:hypothetical protein [Pseudomonadota bacterium]